MSTALLYVTTVLIWGTTWFALKLQLGVVPIAWSIAYRFWLAAAVLLAWSFVRHRRLELPPRALWPLVAVQGLCLFCLNFVCMLNASRWIASGLVAVCFSTAPLWNAFNARLFRRTPLAPRVLAGSALGVAGLLVLFGTEVSKNLWRTETFWGMGLAFAGTYCFSVGNSASSLLQQKGQTPAQTNPWGMLVGAVVISLYALASRQRLRFDASPVYVGTLVYLTLFGSIVAFHTYLTLVGRLGAERAAYCAVLFPIVALNISARAEGYVWTPASLLGLLLVISGNVVVFYRGPWLGKLRSST
ncbi:DMT family transporter [Pendulispora albinea]|uniref:EamA family transporter n=1 Tax=Pendulispora albinea TaxID=2741071 RepID=A0ABZ2M915_9BACT